MMEERRECVAEQGKLARVRSGATTVAPCIANFVAPRHHHRRRTAVESLSSHRRYELLPSHEQPDAKRERETGQREEREKTLRSGFCRCSSLCHRRVWSSPPLESRAKVGEGGHLPYVVAVTSHRATTATLRFLFP
ncbi:uncharacterized protein DS421_7g213580 [Arachis hypogaea]|nr:uncharacterized protein DS421_7g213580 [Arachis hypogaea]